MEAVLHVLILQVALAGLIADRTIDWMIDEQEFQRVLLGFLGLFAGHLGLDHHALVDRGAAGDLKFRKLLDVDQAHAAIAVYRKVFVIAETRHPNPRLLRRLNHGRAGGNFDFLTVDRAFGHGRLPIQLASHDVKAADRL